MGTSTVPYPRSEFGGHVNQHDKYTRRRDHRSKFPQVGSRIVVGLKVNTKQNRVSSTTVIGREEKPYGVSDKKDDGALIEGVHDVDPKRVRTI